MHKSARMLQRYALNAILQKAPKKPVTTLDPHTHAHTRQHPLTPEKPQLSHVESLGLMSIMCSTYT